MPPTPNPDGCPLAELCKCLVAAPTADCALIEVREAAKDRARRASGLLEVGEWRAINQTGAPETVRPSSKRGRQPSGDATNA